MIGTEVSRILISDYERERTRPNYDMIIRLALTLKVTTDELLGISTISSQKKTDKPDLKIVRRVKKIQTLPPSQQKALFKTIDTFIKAAEK